MRRSYCYTFVNEKRGKMKTVWKHHRLPQWEKEIRWRLGWRIGFAYHIDWETYHITYLTINKNLIFNFCIDKMGSM